MDGEQIVGMVIMCVTGFGCAGLFSAIGVWAEKRKDPMNFYSGTSVDPATISDVDAYNRENSKMWKAYAIPYWISGIFQLLSIFWSPLAIFAVILMISSATLGIVWLIRRYTKICNTYMIR